MLVDPFSYYMMSSGRSILASSLSYSIMLCFIIIFVNDRCPGLGASALSGRVGHNFSISAKAAVFDKTAAFACFS